MWFFTNYYLFLEISFKNVKEELSSNANKIHPKFNQVFEDDQMEKLKNENENLKELLQINKEKLENLTKLMDTQNKEKKMLMKN